MSKLDEFNKLVQDYEKEVAEAGKVIPAAAKQKKSTFGGIPASVPASVGDVATLLGIELPSGDAQALLKKMKEQNAAALTMMNTTGVKPEDWLVQVYPDSGGLLHFQAKPRPTDSYYIRWYQLADSPEQYNAVVDAYKGGLYRKSFFNDSEKMYMVCSREGTAVNIPGYGTIDLPDFFIDGI
jgi:hypothetical protein